MTPLIKIQWIGYKTIVVKEVSRFLRIGLETILPPVITMTLYFVIFGRLLIGPLIGEIQGFSYLQFIAPGLIMMAVINGTFMNVAFSFFSSRFNRSIEEMLVSPMSNTVILLGYLSAGILRGLIVGALVSCVALFLTDLRLAHPLMTLLVIFLSAAMLGSLGFIVACFARNFDRISLIPTFVLVPLTYLGGVFYSIDILPKFWKSLSQFNPILYMINAFRHSMLGVSDVNIIWSVLMILVFTVIFFSYGLYLLSRGHGVRS